MDSPNQRVGAMNYKSRYRAGHLSCIVFLAGLAGCIPANHIQRSQLARPCEISVCTNIGTGLERCDCTRYREFEKQMRIVAGTAS